MAEYVIAKYIRLSIEDAKTDSLSVENQRLLLDRHIETLHIPGAEILEFVDNGRSGLNFQRPAMQALLELVHQGRVNCVIVKDLSRFGRSLIENGYYIERVFPLFRVRFISVADGFDSNEHEGGTGGLDIAFASLAHEQYSRDLSRKIKAAKHTRALRGEYVSKNCAFGFKKINGCLEIDEPAAETVRLIFELYKDGHRLSEIAALLYKEKRPTPGEHKKRTPIPSCLWGASNIHTILRDEQYMGTYVAGKTKCVDVGSGRTVVVDEAEWIRIPGHHPAIVDQAVFEVVQERISQRNRPRHKRKLTTQQRSGSSDHVLISKTARPQTAIGSSKHLSPHSGQRAHVERIEGAKRTLYERFILGEIDVQVFQSGYAALDAERDRQTLRL